jgi:hypothetical protein
MQFLLSESEYEDLLINKTHKIDLEKDKLQKLCTKIANEMPILYWDHTEKSTWDCILDDAGKELRGEHYCDECPVQEICPYEDKQWSK